MTAKSFAAVADEGTNFTGSLEMALASDRSTCSTIRRSRSTASPWRTQACSPCPTGSHASRPASSASPTASARCSSTCASRPRRPTSSAWRPSRRTRSTGKTSWMAVEERASFSPDALTGMEANPRWPVPRPWDQDLRATHRLAELDLPEAQRGGRARRARLLRHAHAPRLRGRAHLRRTSLREHLHERGARMDGRDRRSAGTPKPTTDIAPQP